MSRFISFSRYQTKCVKLFRQLITNFKIFHGSASKAMADRDKKRGRQKYKNLNISRTKKSFLDEIRNIFQSF